jgi:hypothetical protein
MVEECGSKGMAESASQDGHCGTEHRLFIHYVSVFVINTVPKTMFFF